MGSGGGGGAAANDGTESNKLPPPLLRAARAARAERLFFTESPANSDDIFKRESPNTEENNGSVRRSVAVSPSRSVGEERTRDGRDEHERRKQRDATAVSVFLRGRSDKHLAGHRRGATVGKKVYRVYTCHGGLEFELCFSQSSLGILVTSPPIRQKRRKVSAPTKVGRKRSERTTNRRTTAEFISHISVSLEARQ